MAKPGPSRAAAAALEPLGVGASFELWAPRREVVEGVEDLDPFFTSLERE